MANRFSNPPSRLALLLITLCIAVGAAPAGAQPEAAKRGAAVVEQWCRLCHVRKQDPVKPGMGAAFETIVLRADRSAAYFAAFLRNDHFPMTTFRLFDHEKADVVAYLTWLAESEK